jgi:hypothetical protein
MRRQKKEENIAQLEQPEKKKGRYELFFLYVLIISIHQLQKTKSSLCAKKNRKHVYIHPLKKNNSFL